MVLPYNLAPSSLKLPLFCFETLRTHEIHILGLSQANIRSLTCWDFISPASLIIIRRRDSECGPHHSINLGTSIHALNHVRITTPCSVHVPGRLDDGKSLLK